MWNKGSLGSNLRAFNKALNEGASLEEAAFRTFTGDNVKSAGFKNVKFNVLEGEKGSYSTAQLTFY